MRAKKPVNPKRQRVFLIVAICLFLVLDCIILGINFYITHQVEEDALAINVAGRQRMLSQRLAKSVLVLVVDESKYSDVKQELGDVYVLFDSTLNAFQYGGKVFDSNGELRPLTPYVDKEVLNYIVEARVYLAEIAPLIEELLKREQLHSIEPLLQVVMRSNEPLLNLMNGLTGRVESLSKQKTMSLRGIQTLAFALALFNFLVIVRLFHERSKRAELQVESFLHLVDGAATCIFVLNQRRSILLANRMCREVFGYSEHAMKRLTETRLFERKGDECYALLKSGERLRVEAKERKYLLNEQEFIILTVTDISGFAKTEAMLAHQANHDELTGLVNRRAMFDRLGLEIARADRANTQIGLLFIDLNQFKPVNDQYGHAVGDEILKQSALRMSRAVRSIDTVARFGGDEFVILIPNVENRSNLELLAGKISSQFHLPFVNSGEKIVLGCSIGLAMYPDDANDACELIKVADLQMYENKSISRLDR